MVTDPAPQDENTDYLDQQFGDYEAAVAKSETATQASQQAAANNDAYLVTTILLAVALFFADDPTFDAGVNFVRARRHRAIVGAV